MNGMHARGVVEATLVAMAILVSGCGPEQEAASELVGKSVSAFDSSWQFVDLESTSQNTTVTPVSRGKGVASNETRHLVGDRGRFLYQTVDDEDVELIIRVDGLTAAPVEATPRGQVGVMIRDGFGVQDQMVAGIWERNGYTALGLVMNKFRVTWRESRTPSEDWGYAYNGAEGEDPTWADPGPDPDPNTDPPAEFYDEIWLRLQRSGNGVALSRSFDGINWSQMASTASGADFVPSGSGPVYLGVFVAGYDPPGGTEGGDGPTITTASIGYVQTRLEGEFEYEYRTSWVAGTQNHSRTSTPGMLNALYVAPNGTAYTYGGSSGGGEWNVDGRKIHDSQTGLVQPMSRQVAFGSGAPQNALTGDGTYVYFVHTSGAGFCVDRRLAGDLGEDAPTSDCDADAPNFVVGKPGGAAARVIGNERRVYVTDFENDRVHVFGTPATGSSQLTRLSSFVVEDRPGAIAVDKRGKVWILHAATKYGTSGSYDLEPGVSPAIRAYDPETATPEVPTAIAEIDVCPAAPPNASNCPPPNASGNCVTNPTALAYDGFGSRDRLLVAENGPSQNVHFFCSLDPSVGSPARCTPAHFGQEGGIFCGATGKVSDGGSDARFHGLSGVGVDEAGAIYVSVGGIYYEVRKYAPDGSRVWWNQGLLNGYNVDFDPGTDGLDVYSSRHHFKLNLGDGSAPSDELRNPESLAYEPGSEWSLEGVTWDPFPDPLAGTVPYEEKDEHGATARSSGNPIVRRIGTAQVPYLFVPSVDYYPLSDDGKDISQVIKIYRFLGERAVPAGSVRITNYCAWGDGVEELAARAACEENPSCICNSVQDDENSVDDAPVLSIWNDTNLNGLEDEPVLKTVSPSFFPEVTGSGLYWTDQMIADPPPAGPFTGFDVDAEGHLWLSFGGTEKDPNGVSQRGAIWKLVRNGELSYAKPTAAERRQYALWPLGINTGQHIRVHLNPLTSAPSIYLFAPDDTNQGTFVYRIDDFLSSQPSFTLPLAPVPPQAEVVRSQFSGYGTHFKTFDVAGDKIFVGELIGAVHVYDANTGAFVTKLFANADSSGAQTQNDANVRAFQRANGEYLVAVNDTGNRGRTLLFRWKPSGCDEDEDCTGTNEYCDAGTCRTRSCSLSDPFGSMELVLAAGLTAEGIAIAPDGRSAIISSKPGTNYELFRVTRESLIEPFGDPEELTNTNSGADERAPWLSFDGRRLFFHRPGSVGSTDLFVSQQSTTTGEFLAPTLVESINSTAVDEGPYLRPDESTLFFSSARGTSTDLWVGTASGSGFSAQGELAVVNSNVYADTRPVVRRDGLALYFHSNRPGVGNDTDGDIFLAQRSLIGDNFAAPVNLSVLNASGIDFPVSLSPDGCSLYVGSNRETGASSTQVFKLYRAQRQATPTQVTVNVTVVGSGTVFAPFNCSSGTCSAQRTFGQSLVVETTGSAIWSGVCGPNGMGTLSSDGIVSFVVNGTCTVAFQ